MEFKGMTKGKQGKQGKQQNQEEEKDFKERAFGGNERGKTSKTAGT